MTWEPAGNLSNVRTEVAKFEDLEVAKFEVGVDQIIATSPPIFGRTAQLRCFAIFGRPLRPGTHKKNYQKICTSISCPCGAHVAPACSGLTPGWAHVRRCGCAYFPFLLHSLDRIVPRRLLRA
eukprot:5443650-Prymnesium_polylepis.1